MPLEACRPPARLDRSHPIARADGGAEKQSLEVSSWLSRKYNVLLIVDACVQAMAHAPLVQHALGLVHANGGVPSSERSTGSHASDHPSASLGSHMSSEPSGSPPAGRAARAGRAADSGLLDLAAAAEQGAWSCDARNGMVRTAVCACQLC